MFFWQCTLPSCRLRFPAAADDPQAAVCPRCSSPTQMQNEAISSRPRVANPKEPPPIHLELLLDNLRSIYNVGAIFRTADGAGIPQIHLCGITATPAHPKLAKTALGAADQVAWCYYQNGVLAADQLLNQGYKLWALETVDLSESIYNISPTQLPSRLVLVLGNEVAGVDPEIMVRCERIIALPMQGFKESLNVTVACGIAVYHLLYGGRENNHNSS